VRPQYPLRTIRPGQASGPLAGGNLSLIISAMGTPWEIDTAGSILFLEDVDENAYAVGRMLWQLRHAGKLAAAAGIVIGACVNCEKITESSPYSLNEHLDMVLRDLDVPVLSGLVLGHTDDQLTIPLGVTATLDASRQTLTVLEPGVVA
jgi:muramoyltetrapeptide carboxypeptidase